jgi:hypothetical protein
MSGLELGTLSWAKVDMMRGSLIIPLHLFVGAAFGDFSGKFAKSLAKPIQNLRP